MERKSCRGDGRIEVEMNERRGDWPDRVRNDGEKGQ